MRAAGEPVDVGLEFHAELVVVNAQIAVAAARDRLWHHGLHLLRHHADKGLVAAEIAEAIEAEAVIEMAEQHDVVLQRDVGAPAAATPTPTAAKTASAATTAEAAAPARKSSAASAHAATAGAGKARTAARRGDVGRPAR